jgi:phosphinothricin acetyltransferase
MIRKAQLTDLPQLTAIYNQAIQDGKCTCESDIYTVEGRRTWFDAHQNKQYPLFMYEKNGSIIGYYYLSAYRSGRAALKQVVEISYYLDFRFHGMGFGSEILQDAITTAGNLGYKFLIMILMSTNKKSISLLKKFDFSCWGTMPAIVETDDFICDHLYYGKKI